MLACQEAAFPDIKLMGGNLSKKISSFGLIKLFLFANHFKLLLDKDVLLRFQGSLSRLTPNFEVHLTSHVKAQGS